MTRLVTADFEGASGTAGAGFTAKIGSPTTSIDQAYTGSKSMRLTASNQSVYLTVSTASTAYYTRSWLYTPARTNDVMSIEYSGAQRIIQVQSDGSIKLTDNGANSQTLAPAATIPVSTWVEIETKIEWDSSGIIISIAVNGVSVCASTHDGSWSAYGAPTRIGFGNYGSAVSGGGNYYFDDVAINDDQSGSDNTWIDYVPPITGYAYAMIV